MSTNSQRLLLITAPVNLQWQTHLQQLVPKLQIVMHTQSDSKEISDDIWQRTEILYTLGTLPEPEKVPHLRWIQLYSAGADQALHHPLFQRPITFTTSSGVHAINIAEYVLMMQLNWFHHFPLINEWQLKGQWAPEDVRPRMFGVEELRGKTIGIVGYGSIGREVARLASAFGMRVIAQQRSDDHRDTGFIFPGVGDPDGTIPDQYYSSDQFHTLLSESNVVVIGVPLTPHTTHLFDEAAFHAMKPEAFLINIARGEVCDQQALVHALQEGHIAGAALDVTDPEPLPDDHPLWKLPNVIISPHISGGTNHYNERALQIFEENLRRYLAHEPLYNTINKEQGY